MIGSWIVALQIFREDIQRVAFLRGFCHYDTGPTALYPVGEGYA